MSLLIINKHEKAIKKYKRDQLKLNHMVKDINRNKAPSKTISLMYANKDSKENIVMMNKEKRSVSMLPKDKMNEIRLGEKGDTITLKAISKKISSNQVKDVHYGYNKYWIFNGAAYGVKNGFIARLDGSTPSSTNCYDVPSHSTMHWREELSSSTYIDNPVYEFFSRKNKGLNKVYKGIYGLRDAPGWGQVADLMTLINYDFVSDLRYFYNNKKIYRAGSNYKFNLKGSSTDGRQNGFMCEYRRKTIIFNQYGGGSGTSSPYRIATMSNRIFSWTGLNYYITEEVGGNDNTVHAYWRSGGYSSYRQINIQY